jgi:hypothetical protein
MIDHIRDIDINPKDDIVSLASEVGVYCPIAKPGNTTEIDRVSEALG